jgi:hypothetical protein
MHGLPPGAPAIADLVPCLRPFRPFPKFVPRESRLAGAASGFPMGHGKSTGKSAGMALRSVSDTPCDLRVHQLKAQSGSISAVEDIPGRKSRRCSRIRRYQSHRLPRWRSGGLVPPAVRSPRWPPCPFPRLARAGATTGTRDLWHTHDRAKRHGSADRHTRADPPGTMAQFPAPRRLRGTRCRRARRHERRRAGAGGTGRGDHAAARDTRPGETTRAAAGRFRQGAAACPAAGRFRAGGQPGAGCCQPGGARQDPLPVRPAQTPACQRIAGCQGFAPADVPGPG